MISKAHNMVSIISHNLVLVIENHGSDSTTHDGKFYRCNDSENRTSTVMMHFCICRLRVQ